MNVQTTPTIVIWTQTAAGQYRVVSSEGDDDDEGQRKDRSAEKSGEHLDLSQVIDDLRTSVMTRFQSVLFDPVYRMCSFLDPRFKITYCQVNVVVYWKCAIIKTDACHLQLFQLLKTVC